MMPIISHPVVPSNDLNFRSSSRRRPRPESGGEWSEQVNTAHDTRPDASRDGSGKYLDVTGPGDRIRKDSGMSTGKSQS